MKPDASVTLFVVLFVAAIIGNLALLAAGVWIVVKVLQWMGVL